MHIHHNPMISGSSGMHSSAAGKAATAQRASEAWRKLTKSSALIDANLSFAELLTIRGGVSDGSGQGKPNPDPQNKSETNEDGTELQPISVWA
jgi:hypothetical protein